MPAVPHWYAIWVTARHEKKIATKLRAKGLHVFLPLYRARRAWSDRVQQLDLPLFPGYLFCLFGFADWQKVVNTPGIVSIVPNAEKPLPIPAEEIGAMQKITSSGLPVEPRSYKKNTATVCVNRGPVAGVKGTVDRDAGSLWLSVSINPLEQSAAVQISAEDL